MLKKFLYLCFITLSLGQFSAIYKQGDASVYLFDICIFVFAVIGISQFLLSKKKFYIPKPYIFFGGFIGVAILSLIRVVPHYDFYELLVSAFYLFRFISYFCAGLVVYNMVLSKNISTKELLNLFIYSGIFIALCGFVQLKLLPDFETLDSSLGWDPHKNRLASTFFDPNFTGAYLVLVLTILFNRFFSKTVTKKDALWFFIIFVALFLTFSRSAWLMLAAVVLIYGLFKNKLLLVLALVVSFSAYYAVPRIQTRLSGITDPADSAKFRLISWQNTFSIIKDNPVIGVGFNTFRYVQKDYGFLDPDNFLIHSGAGSDSSLLFILATTGVTGFLFYCCGLLSSLGSSKNKIFTLAILISILGGSQFINALFYPPILFYLLIAGFSINDF